MIIRGTHRAYMGADTEIEAFVRDDEGPMSLSGAEQIIVRVRAMDRKEVATFVGTGDAGGRITFTVDGEAAKRLQPGVFGFRVYADDRTIYTAILEIV